MSEQLKALEPFLNALEANDSDSLGRLYADDLVLFTLSGSWSAPVSVTLGDLRKLRGLSTELRHQHTEIREAQHLNIDAVAKAIAEKCGGACHWALIGDLQRDGYRGIAKAAIGAMR